MTKKICGKGNMILQGNHLVKGWNHLPTRKRPEPSDSMMGVEIWWSSVVKMFPLRQ